LQELTLPEGRARNELAPGMMLKHGDSCRSFGNTQRALTRRGPVIDECTLAMSQLLLQASVLAEILGPWSQECSP
jgi:hypothetical protein